jgi:DNA-binding response OmpR family regulator
MDNIRVLLAEDELALAHIVRESLEERDFKVTLCYDGEHALQNYKNQKPDILVLDVMMPKMDGFELARQIRATDTATPIIFLTARSQTKDVITGFELGANDYLKKPFSVEELIVRIKVLLTKNRMLLPEVKTSDNNTPLTLGTLQFDASRNTIQLGLNKWNITARESELLNLLYKNKHQVVPKAVLLNTIWGDDSFFNARSLDVFITRLRKHLDADPNIQIINIRGVGYKLVY